MHPVTTDEAPVVSIEVTPLSRGGGDRGLGRYTRAVLDAASGLPCVIMEVDVGRRDGRWAELADLAYRQAALRSRRPDVFHATNPFVCALKPPSRSVCTILDTIPLDVRAYQRSGVKTNLFFRLAARADAVLTLSTFSAERIVKRLRVPEDRIIVAPLPPSPVFRPADRDGEWSSPSDRNHPTSAPYVVALADRRTPDPRKRIDWLPRIAKSLAYRGLRLVVIGGMTDVWQHGSPLEGLGRVDDETARDLFARAQAFVYTSAYEGQGLPALEAMASGTPVVAMRNSAIAEVVGPGGILLDEAGSDAAEQLAASCVAITLDPAMRAELRAAGLAHVEANYSVGRFRLGLSEAYGLGRGS